MSGGVKKDDLIDKLLQEAREEEKLSEDILAKRRQLLELTKQHPSKVIEYFDRQPEPTDPRERLLRTKLLRLAAHAILNGLDR